MRVEHYTESKGRSLVQNSKWRDRYFKSEQELTKQFGADWGCNLPQTGRGQSRLVHTHVMYSMLVPLKYTEAFMEEGYLDYSLPVYLKGFGLEGDTYQEAWDECFMEEMFMPVGWTPEKVTAPIEEGWFPTSTHPPEIGRDYKVMTDETEIFYDATYQGKGRFETFFAGVIENVHSWTFKVDGFWEQGEPPTEGSYEISFEGKLYDASWNDIVPHPGGESTANCGPCFVVDGYPSEADWWREFVDEDTAILKDAIKAIPKEPFIAPGIPASGSVWLDDPFGSGASGIMVYKPEGKIYNFGIDPIDKNIKPPIIDGSDDDYYVS